jgi:hypothetical protein
VSAVPTTAAEAWAEVDRRAADKVKANETCDAANQAWNEAWAAHYDATQAARVFGPRPVKVPS